MHIKGGQTRLGWMIYIHVLVVMNQSHKYRICTLAVLHKVTYYSSYYKGVIKTIVSHNVHHLECWYLKNNSDYI